MIVNLLLLQLWVAQWSINALHEQLSYIMKQLKL